MDNGWDFIPNMIWLKTEPQKHCDSSKRYLNLCCYEALVIIITIMIIIIIIAIVTVTVTVIVVVIVIVIVD